MKYLLSILIALGSSHCLFSQELADFVPPSNFAKGAAIVDAPDVILWHFKLFVIGPRNMKLFNEAVEKARKELKPGESAKYYVVGEYAAGTVFFRYLEHTDRPVYRKVSERTIALIELGKARYILKPGPTSVLSKEAFGELKKHLKASPLTYADHCFGTEAMNALNGYSVDAGDTATALRLRTKLEWKDLLQDDLRARAVANGTVILVANANEDTYRVYNVDTKQLDKKAYPKGEYLKSLGNTVWLYTKTASGEEYTTVYANLDKIDAKLGQPTLRADSIIGQWKTLASPPLNWSVWRVHGPGQRFFLRENGVAKPYRVLPVSQETE